jgi:hypothetical protein
VIRDVYATNVMGVIHMTQAVLPVFKARPEGGRGDVIFIGSLAGRDPYVGGTVSLTLEFGDLWADKDRFIARVKRQLGRLVMR